MAGAALLNIDAASDEARRRLAAGGSIGDMMAFLNRLLAYAGWPRLAQSTFYKAQGMARMGFDAGSYEALVVAAMSEARPRWRASGHPPSPTAPKRGSREDVLARIADMTRAGFSPPAVPPVAALEELAAFSKSRPISDRVPKRKGRRLVDECITVETPMDDAIFEDEGGWSPVVHPLEDAAKARETDEPAKSEFEASDDEPESIEFVVERLAPRSDREQALEALEQRDLDDLRRILARGRLSFRELTNLLADASRRVEPMDWNHSCPFCMALMSAGADPEGSLEDAPEGRTKWLMRVAIDVRGGKARSAIK